HAMQSVPQSPQGFFSAWLDHGVEIGAPFMSDMFFTIERSFWAERRRSNILLVHYADLKSDLAAEMHRISTFLEIPVGEAIWPTLVEAATFDAMKRDGAAILPGVERELIGGVDSFLAQGSGYRWQEILSEDLLVRYAAKLSGEASPGLAAWLHQGRLA